MADKTQSTQIELGSTFEGVEQSMVVIPVQKLDADDYSTEDLDAVAESASGSGNLNYLMMQAQQSHAMQDMVSMDTASDNFDINGSNNGHGFSPYNSSSLSSNGGGSPLAEAQIADFNTAVDSGVSSSQGSEYRSGDASGASLSSISASAAEKTAQVGSGGDGNVFQQNTVELAGSGTNGKNGSDGKDGNDGNDGENPTPPPPETGAGEPLITIDTDIDLGDTLTDTLEVVTDTLGDTVETLTQTNLNELPSAVVNELNNVTGTINTVTDTVDGVVGNTVETVTNLLEGGVSLSDPLSNLHIINNVTSDLLGGNSLGFAVDVNNIIQADLGINLDGTLPGISTSLTPEYIGGDTLGLNSNELLAQTGVEDAVTSVEEVTDTLIQDTPLGDITGSVDSATAELTDNVAEQLTDITESTADTLDTLAETVTEPVDEVIISTTDTVETVLEPLADATDEISDVLEPVGSVDDAADSLTDTVNSLLGGDSEGDSDLFVNVEAGGESIVEDVTLDPVEEVVGDIDIDILADADPDGISDGDVTISAENELLNPASQEELIGDLGLDDLNEETLLSDTGTDEVIGDLLPSDTPDDGSTDGGDILVNALPDPGGSVDDGLAGLLDDQSDSGGLGGLF